MVLISVDSFSTTFASFSVPIKNGTFGFVKYISQLSHFADEGCNAVGFFDFQALQSAETESGVLQSACHDVSLCQVRLVGEVTIYMSGLGYINQVRLTEDDIVLLVTRVRSS